MKRYRLSAIPAAILAGTMTAPVLAEGGQGPFVDPWASGEGAAPAATTPATVIQPWKGEAKPESAPSGMGTPPMQGIGPMSFPGGPPAGPPGGSSMGMGGPPGQPYPGMPPFGGGQGGQSAGYPMMQPGGQGAGPGGAGPFAGPSRGSGMSMSGPRSGSRSFPGGGSMGSGPRRGSGGSPGSGMMGGGPSSRPMADPWATPESTTGGSPGAGAGMAPGGPGPWAGGMPGGGSMPFSGPGGFQGPGGAMPGRGMPGMGYGPAMPGQGMMGPPGMMGAQDTGAATDLLGVVWNLDLDDEQRKKIGAMADEIRQQRWEMMGKIMEHNKAIQRLNEEQMGHYQAMSELRQRLQTVGSGAVGKAEALLTPEQHRQLEEARRQVLPQTP